MPDSPPIIEAPNAPSRTAQRPRIVIAHDWLCGVRGGEHVLERVCALVEREFEPASLLVMFNDGGSIGPAVDTLARRGLVRASWLNGLVRLAPGIRRWLLPLYPCAVNHLSRTLARLHRAQPVDLIISTSSAAIKGLRPPPGVPHICICFSPARYVWGRDEEDRPDGTAKGRLRRAGLSLFGGVFRAWDRASASRVSTFVAISTHIRDRIASAYGRDSVIIYPPVRTGFFTPDPSVPRENFWLCVGAVEPYKRADLAIDAATRAGVRLKVAGVGSQLSTLKRRHAGNASIEFLGRVQDPDLRTLYQRANLLIFPQVEDFGIVALEAQACGLPVVARAKGGALDTIVNDRTGSFFQDPNPLAIVEAAAQAPHDAAACRAQAERFNEQRFDSELLALIRTVLPGAKPGASPR